MRFLGLFILIFLGLEIFSIVWLAGKIGGLFTFLLIVLSFLAGSFVLRNSGFSRVMVLGEVMRSGGISLYQLLWPIRLPLAGVLLMSPGFISSFFALLLLIPFKGKPLSESEKFSSQFQGFNHQQHHYSSQQKGNHHDDDVIEGEFTVKEGQVRTSATRLEEK